MLESLKWYRSTHGGELKHVPIGMDVAQDLLVVVDNKTGVVFVEDHDRASFSPLAKDIAELFEGLRVKPVLS